MRRENSKSEITGNNENPFALSTGDLMAGLLFIFVLLLSYALLQVQEKAESDEQIVGEYNRIKTQLYIDLKSEFKEDLKTWNAVLDSIDLSVRFQEPSTLFDYDSYTLKKKFKDILNDFFPRYIQILSHPNYIDNIQEIRIEGHTDNKGSYFYNMRLSQDRTRSVLEYCMNLQPLQNKQEWIISKVTANGLSFSQPITDGVNVNDKLSRRVEFRIRTNAEKQLEDIVTKRNAIR